MNKDKKFSIRLTDKHLSLIKSKAKKKSVSQYCREILLNESCGGSSVASELLLLRQDIARIGNNINQIAHRVNSGEDTNIKELSLIINNLRDMTNKKLERVR